MNTNKYLFYGPKGCGKTIFSQAMGGMITNNNSPLWVSVKIKTSYILGNPYERIKQAFNEIERRKVNQVVIDDFEKLLTNLDSNLSAKNYLLERIYALSENQIFIATTRNPELIEEAIIDDFDRLYPFPYPDESDRLAIIKIHTVEKIT